MDTEIFVKVIDVSAEFTDDLKTYFVSRGHITKYQDIDIVNGNGVFLLSRNIDYIVSIGHLQDLAAKDLEMRVILTKHGY